MESSRKPRDGLVSKRRPIDFFRTPWGGWFSSGEPASGRILDEVLLLKRRPIDFFRTPWGGWVPSPPEGVHGWRPWARRLLRPCPHLPPFALQPAHTLLTPLGTHRSGDSMGRLG